MRIRNLVVVGALIAGMSVNANAEQGSLDDIIGKRLVAGNGTVFVIKADGTMGGSFKGKDVVGVYKRNGNEVCSTYSAPKPLTGKEFCSTPAINNGKVVFNRRDGSKSPEYEIQD